MMIYVHCLVLLLLAGQVELIKFSFKAPAPIQQQPLEQAELAPQPPPPPPQQPIQQQSEQQYQEEFYPSRQQSYGYQQQQQQQHYGRPQSYYPAYQPPALAYVIVRPLAPSYPYYSPQVRYTAPLFQAPLAAPLELSSSGTKGGRLQPAEQYSTKDGSRPEYIREEEQTQQKEELFPQQQQQQILQHQQPIQQQPIQQQQQHPEQLHDAAMSKWLKFKSSIDKLAASARSKLTMGSSSYYVQGEEIVAPQAAPQPLQQEQVRTNDIQLTRDEQQRIEDARSTKQQQQQHFDDGASQTKLEDATSQATKSEDAARGTKQLDEQPARQQQQQIKLEDAARGTKQLDEQPARQQQQQQQQTKLEASAADGAARKTKVEQELKLEQEPQREKEKDLLEQVPVQQAPIQQAPLQQAPLQQAPLQQERYNSEKGQQQREEYRAPVKSDREQLRLFNGQQPAPTYIDSDGFGRRQSFVL